MNIIFVTNTRFPQGSAEAVRLYTIAQICKDLGHDVAFFALGAYTGKVFLNNGEFDYTSLTNKGNTFFDKVCKYVFFKKRLKKMLKIYSKRIDAIIFNHIPENAISYLKKYSLNHGSTLILDSGEWFSPEQFKNGKKKRNYKKNNKLITKIIDKYVKTISISNYLTNHYTSRGIITVKIPAILDIESIQINKKVDFSRFTIIYAGQPGKKDYLKEVIEGISLLSKDEQKKLELRIIGVNRQQLIDFCDVNENYLQDINDSVKILGRVDRKIVIENLKEADFTVLIRSSTQRYAKAGFPTKVVESLASGTPVILNLTSDLKEYIFDNYNGIIIKDETALEFSKALKKMLSLNNKERTLMQKNARMSAEKYFDYKLYKNELSKLLESKECE